MMKRRSRNEFGVYSGAVRDLLKTLQTFHMPDSGGNKLIKKKKNVSLEVIVAVLHFKSNIENLVASCCLNFV